MRPVLRLSPLKEGAPEMLVGSPMDSSDSLVFNMDGEGSVHRPTPYHQSAAAAIDTIRQLDVLLTPVEPAAVMLARHVELAAGGAHRVDPEYLATVLQRLGYSAKLHECSASLYKFKQGVRHDYISVCLPENSAAGLATYIVEPNFRDCFCVAHPTPRYAAVLDSLPAAVVASKACMHRAVSLLSREMALSFADQGEDLPPWRTPQALLSKWQLAGSAASSTAGGAGCSAWAAVPAGGELFAPATQRSAFGAA